MSSFNKVILMGNLTRDPELKYTQSSIAVCSFALACNRKYKKGDEWVEEATFIDVTIFGKRAEAFQRFHKRGQSAFVEGSLRMDQWEDKKTGAKRSKLYVVAESWEFVNGDKNASQVSRQDEETSNLVGYQAPTGGGQQEDPDSALPF